MNRPGIAIGSVLVAALTLSASAESGLGLDDIRLGIEFNTGDMFPPEYRGQLFIAEPGSRNRSEKIGYRIMLVRMGDDGPSGYEIFADGWLKGDEVSGRPVDLLFLDDGSMLVSDDKSGSIYRISYQHP